MSTTVFFWLVAEIAVLGGAAWSLDLFAGKKLGGVGLKILWLTFFAKLAAPVGLLALVPRSLPALPSPSSWTPTNPPLSGTFPLSSPLPPAAGPISGGIPFSWEATGWVVLAVPTAVLLSLMIVRLVKVGLALSRLPEIEGEVKHRTEALAKTLGLRVPIRLLRSASGVSPASWDLMRPTVLLPWGWEERTPEAEQDQILLHELVHLKHHDPLLGLAAQVLTCVYWFHPAVWVARNRLVAGMENACDQEVLSLSEGRSRKVYGRALLRTVEHSLAGLLPGTRAATSDKNELKRRIQMIQEFQPRRGSRVRLTLLAAVFLAAVSLVPVSGSEAEPPTSPASGALVDDIHRPFVDDPAVKGVWKTVDFVDKPSDFVLGKTVSLGPLYLKSLTFYPHGQMGAQATEALPEGPLPWFSWTKGVVMHQSDVTASAYTIEWRGFFTDVMFFEWKSGDYTIRHQKPKYYVLVRG